MSENINHSSKDDTNQLWHIILTGPCRLVSNQPTLMGEVKLQFCEKARIKEILQHAQGYIRTDYGR